MTGKKIAAWPTFSGTSMFKLVADLFVANELAEHCAFDRFDSIWKVALCHLGILVRKGTDGDVYLSLGPVWGYVAIGVAVIFSGPEAAGHVDVKPITASTVTLLVVTDWSEWEASAVQWHAPLHSLLLDPGCKPQIAGAASQMRPLLQVAAACAFWDLPESFITKVIADVGLDTSGTVLEKLQRLIQSTLGPISEEEVCNILMQRFAVLDKHADEWMAQDDLRAELDEADAQEVESCPSRREEQQKKHSNFMREFHALRQRLHPPRPAPGRRGRGRGGGREGSSNSVRLAVKTLPYEGLTQAMASPLVPVSAAIHKDMFNGRWRLTWRSPYVCRCVAGYIAVLGLPR